MNIEHIVMRIGSKPESAMWEQDFKDDHMGVELA
jgi:hypothetical protein